ncbi:MAG: FadR/GntR family transcriptional regulator [Pseudomonadota bacterium]
MTDDSLIHLNRLPTRNVSGAVLESLAEMVRRANLSVGDRLPSELLIAEKLGVGRSTVREALNRWEGIGLIRRKRGVGTFIVAPIPRHGVGVDPDTQLDGAAILRLLEVRRSLESDMVRHAALRATKQQQAAIQEHCAELMDIVARGTSYREADLAFHRAVANASANPIYHQLIGILDQTIEKSSDSPFDKPGFGRSSFPFHRDLADAISRRDPDQAETAVARIIAAVEDEVRQMIELKPSDS